MSERLYRKAKEIGKDRNGYQMFEDGHILTEVVLVQKCEHGKIDAHFVAENDPNGFAPEWAGVRCPGAGLEKTETKESLAEFGERYFGKSET